MKNYMEKLAKDFFGKDLNEFFQIRDKDFVSMKNIWYKFTKEGLIYKNITNRKGWAISENTLSRLLTGEYEIRYVPKKGETYFLLKPLEITAVEDPFKSSSSDIFQV